MTADLSPDSVALASMPHSFTLTLLNEAEAHVLDATNVTAPEGFALLGVTSLVSVERRARAVVLRDTIHLRGLGLLRGQTAKLVFEAMAPPEAGAYTWGIDARRSSDFASTDNVFGLDLARSNLTTNVGAIVPCPANARCQARLSSRSTQADVDVDPGSGGRLSMVLLPTGAINCEGYTGTSDTVRSDVSAKDRSQTLTITLSADLVGDRSAEDFQVCYVSDLPFADRFDNVIPAGEAGLLPDGILSEGSGRPSNPPCVLSRVDNDDRSVSVSFFAPPGDPKGHT